MCNLMNPQIVETLSNCGPLLDTRRSGILKGANMHFNFIGNYVRNGIG